MPKRGSIAKRQRPPMQKPRHPAVLKRNKETTNNIISVGVSIGDRELKFARALADTEERVRAASLKSLRKWLRRNAEQLDGAELDKLWMALFYCVWMADKRHRISAVIRDVIALEDILGHAHIRALFRCMTREWLGIDKHRVDKFYELLNVALELCVKRTVAANSDEALRAKVDELNTCIAEELTANVNRGGKGILMHVMDKWVDIVLKPIMEKAATFSQDSMHSVWDSLLRSFLAILKSPDDRLNAVKIRFEERVIAELATVVSSESLDIDNCARHDMLNGVSESLFAIASDSSVPDECRQRLYKLRTSIKVVLLDLKKDKNSASS